MDPQYRQMTKVDLIEFIIPDPETEESDVTERLRRRRIIAY